MRYLGVDFGLKRVGLAISEGTLASPWKVVEVKGLKDAAWRVLEIVHSEGFGKVVVGLPGGKMGKNVIGFVNLLKNANLDVETADETLTTQRATQELINLGSSRKRRKVSDDYSAAIILQEYLDQVR